MNKLKKVLFFANTDWYLFNFRVPLAKYLSQNGFEVVMISPSGEFGERISQTGIRWISVPMDRRSFNLLAEFRLLRAIVKTYKEECPDIVHHFTIKCVVYGAIAAKIARTHASISAVTGLGHIFIDSSLRSRLLRPVVSMLLRFAISGDRSRLILQNPDDAALLTQSRLISNSRITVIRGSGVDTTRFRLVDRADREAPIRVLVACRLLRDKGIYEYIDAIKQIKTKKLDVQFLLAGSPDSGNPSAVSLSLIRQWQTNNLITYLGQVEDMVQLLKEVEIAVLPSYREGAPRALIEAAATGLPLIATDVPGCREVVDDGVNGLLIPPKNASLLAEAITYLVRNPKIRERMGKAGRKKVLEEFDENIVLRKTFQVYKELQITG